MKAKVFWFKLPPLGPALTLAEQRQHQDNTNVSSDCKTQPRTRLLFEISSSSSESSYALNHRNLLSVLRDLLDTCLYLPHPLPHDTDVGHIHRFQSLLDKHACTAVNLVLHLPWYPSFLTLGIINARNVMFAPFWREMAQAKVCINCLVHRCKRISNSKRHCLTIDCECWFWEIMKLELRNSHASILRQSRNQSQKKQGPSDDQCFSILDVCPQFRYKKSSISGVHLYVRCCGSL